MSSLPPNCYVASGNQSSRELIFVILAKRSLGWMCCPALVLSDNGCPGLHRGCSWGVGGGEGGDMEGKLCHHPARAVVDQWQCPHPAQRLLGGAWKNS